MASLLSLLGFWPDEFSAEVRFYFSVNVSEIEESYLGRCTDDLLMATSASWLTCALRQLYNKEQREVLLKHIALFCDGHLECENSIPGFFYMRKPWSDLLSTFEKKRGRQAVATMAEIGPCGFSISKLFQEDGMETSIIGVEDNGENFQNFKFRLVFIRGKPVMYSSRTAGDELFLPFAAVLFTAHTAIRLNDGKLFSDSASGIKHRALIREWLTLARTGALNSSWKAGNRLKSIFMAHGLVLPSDGGAPQSLEKPNFSRRMAAPPNVIDRFIKWYVEAVLRMRFRTLGLIGGTAGLLAPSRIALLIFIGVVTAFGGVLLLYYHKRGLKHLP